MRFLKQNWFSISIIGILILSIALRFYDYSNRWGLAYDQARDVLVASEALSLNKPPLIGPFTSAGQFVYGPQWYWLLMLMVGIGPWFVLTPWIIQTILFVLVVLLMIFLGKELAGRMFGIVLGLFTAVSPAQISQSTNLTSPSMVGIFSMLSVYFLVLSAKYNKSLYTFFLGFCIATSINIHFQAIGLCALIPVYIILSKRTLANVFALLAGFFIPFIPLIIFDLSNNFFESRNILDYYMYGQYRIYVPNRWLTYVGEFWPNAWAHIIGGYTPIIYILLGLLVLFLVYALIRKNISKNFLIIFASFTIMFIMLRYYRGERFASYVVFLHPFVLILTAWVCMQIVKINKIIGLLLISILVIGSLLFIVKDIQNASNYSGERARNWARILTETYPNQKFAVYDLKYGSPGTSLPLVMYLNNQNKIDDKGYRVGFGAMPKEEAAYHTPIRDDTGYEIWDLNASSSAVLSREGWALVNPSAIHKSTVEWFYGKNL